MGRGRSLSQSQEIGDDIVDPFARAAKRLERERPPRDRRLREIAETLRNSSPLSAISQLENHLAHHPKDADAVLLIAEAHIRLDRRPAAIELLARCLAIAPDFLAARFLYARQLLRANRFRQAHAEADRLLQAEGDNPLFLQLKANASTATGDYVQALSLWKSLADAYPDRAASWVKLGDALRGAGRGADAIAAYRKALALEPSLGLAWWSLSNLKTFRFGAADIAAMERELEAKGISADDRINLLYALGKACEDLREFGRSYAYYAKANAAKRLHGERYAKPPGSRLAGTKAVFTPTFLAGRSGAGCESAAPIFVLGQQRSGSTLVEQILSSHSLIEGLGELKYIPALANRLADGPAGGAYPWLLEKIDLREFRTFGEQYVEDADVHRKLGRPLFVDKNPSNYHHLGLIHLILPNAKIVDVRRHPAACCLSIFKQNLSTASMRLEEIGEAYKNYVELMAHFDRVLPGKVHRVIYERLVADPENEIRKLLDYLQLPFERQCLSFHESERPVFTPSSEQVRQPVSVANVDHWQNFAPWLSPLLTSLGPVLAAYPDIPDDLRSDGGQFIPEPADTGQGPPQGPP